MLSMVKSNYLTKGDMCCRRDETNLTVIFAVLVFVNSELQTVGTAVLKGQNTNCTNTCFVKFV